MILRRMKAAALIVVTVAVVLSAVVAGRLVWANHEVNKKEVITKTFDASKLGSTDSLSILPLFEAWAGSNEVQTGHGISYLIKTDHARVLLDLGNNEGNLEPSPLLHNMEQLGVEMNEMNALVISHNHPDHVGGAENWMQGTLSTGGQEDNLSGLKLYLPVKLSIPGIEPELALDPMIIAPGVATLGRQPYVQPFPFCLWEPLGWEQSIVVHVEGRGLVIITGCGHPTLERIIQRAEAIFSQPVIGIVGGFHYGKAGKDALQPHLDFLALRNPELVALSPHDSTGGVLQIFEAAFEKSYRYITVGREIGLP